MAAKELDILQMGRGNMCPKAATLAHHLPAQVTGALQTSHWSFAHGFKIKPLTFLSDL